MEDQEIFVPLKQIGKMQKNALAEATAMAKMKDEHFELVVNIQKFTPEEVKVYVEGQSVVVQAKKCTQEGFVTDAYENKFNLPEDVDVSRLVWIWIFPRLKRLPGNWKDNVYLDLCTSKVHMYSEKATKIWRNLQTFFDAPK